MSPKKLTSLGQQHIQETTFVKFYETQLTPSLILPSDNDPCISDFLQLTYPKEIVEVLIIFKHTSRSNMLKPNGKEFTFPQGVTAIKSSRHERLSGMNKAKLENKFY